MSVFDEFDYQKDDMNKKYKRDKFDILEEILIVCQEQRLKTEIVYRCNLNFSIIKNYLKILIINNCLFIDKEYYKITANGLILLTKLKEIKNILDK